MRRLTVMVCAAVLAAACGGTDGGDAATPAADEGGATTPAEDAWVSEDGVALVAGDCFLQSRPGGEGTPNIYEVVPCDTPHDGEVTHVTDCALGAGPDDEVTRRSLAASAAYVGVPADEFLDWLDAENLTAMMNWSLNGWSLCYLVDADGGSLTGAYG